MKKAYKPLALFLTIILLSSCWTESKFTEDRIAMGTSVSITVFSRMDAKLLDGAFLLLSDIEREISAKDGNSYISKINNSAGIDSVAVPEDVYILIERSLELAKETDGLFNPAIGALVDLWGITTENPHVPDEAELSSVLPLLSLEDVILDDGQKTVFLAKRGMKLDLGGIGKGYAADKLRDYLSSNGVKRALINLGGNVYALGWKDESSEEKWRVGIVDPIDQSTMLTSVDVENKAVVTSGGYERYFEKDGVRYHHILDSKTGFPSDSDVLSATIVSSDSTLADALSTAVFSGGTEKAKEFADRFKVYVIVYTKAGEILRFGEL